VETEPFYGPHGSFLRWIFTVTVSGVRGDPGLASFGASDYVEGVVGGVEGSGFAELCYCVAGGLPGVVGGVC